MDRSTNLLIICLASLYLIIPASSQFRFMSEFCSDIAGNYTADSTYHKNLDFMLTILTNQAKLSLFNNDTVGAGIDQTYGLFMCRGDLNVEQCHICVKNASTTILELCPVQKEAVVWFRECMVRYSDLNIFARYEEYPMVYTWKELEFSNPDEFGEIYSKAANGLIMEAAYNKSRLGYATVEANVTLFEAVYVLAQCTPDIIGTQCDRCLTVALRNMGGCCGTAKVHVAMHMPSCWLRYDITPIVGEFTDNSPVVTPTSSSGSLDARPSFESDDSPSVPPPPSSPGSSSGATTTSGGLTILSGILMAVIGISLISSALYNV